MRHDVIGLKILVSVTKYLYVLVIGDHYATLFELILLPEALDTLLAEAHKLVAQLSAGLEERTDRAAHHDLDLHGLVRLGLTDCLRRFCIFFLCLKKSFRVLHNIALILVEAECGRLLRSGLFRLYQHFNGALLITDHFWRPIFLSLQLGRSSYLGCRIG